MKGSKTTTTCIDDLCSSTKKQAKNQKEIQSYNEKFAVTQYIKWL